MYGAVAACGAAEVSAVVATGVVLARKSYGGHHRCSQHIAYDGHAGGGGGGRQTQRAYFGSMSRGQCDIGIVGQRAVRIAGDDNHGYAFVETSHQGDQVDNLARLARIGHQQHHVMGLQHAQVAVLCFAGVKIDRRGAGGRECRGNVLGYLPGLAHAGGDQLAAEPMYTLYYECDGMVVGIADRNGGDGAAFGVQYMAHGFLYFAAHCGWWIG